MIHIDQITFDLYYSPEELFDNVSIDDVQVFMGTKLWQSKSVVGEGHGVDGLGEERLLIWFHVGVLDLVVNGGPSVIQLFLKDTRPQHHVSQDLDCGLEPPGLDRSSVNERITGGLAITDSTKLFESKKKVVLLSTN